jgi:drug/metabolite transporter (DMT)-like permease
MTIPPALGLVVGVLAVSTASTFIRLAQANVSSLALAAWRLTFASVLLAPFAIAAARVEWRKLRPTDWALLAASGAALAVHFYTWITSLAMTSVAASVVLVSTNPLFVALISHFLLGDRVRPRVFGGIVVAVLGSAIIGLGDVTVGPHRLLGDSLALVGAATVAIYMLIGRRQRARLSLLGYIFPVYGFAAVILMTFAIVTHAPLTGYPAQAWMWLLLVALIPQIIGHSSFNWALGHVPPTYVSLVVLAEPIGSTLLAWLVLGEPPTPATVLGGGIILGGIVLATMRKTRNQE